jgi:Putative metallopeptidase family (DUF6782)
LLDAKLRHDLPLEPELYLESLSRIGMIDAAPPDLYRRLLEFYASQVLGYYDPRGDEMILVDNSAFDTKQQELVWAHELEHAVQERRFGLPHRLLAMSADSDAQRAASAIAEGDAMLVMLVEAGDHDRKALSDAAAALRRQATATPTPPGLPRFFVADLVFPYTAGLDAVLRAYRGNGWPGVDALLRSPPGSTAALLHPDRPPPSATIGRVRWPATPPGWRQVLTDTLGEWGLRFLLARRIDPSRAARLAAIWDGDRLRLARERSNPDRWALAWYLRCRTSTGCRALEAALRSELPHRLVNLPGRGASLRLDLRHVGNRALEIEANWPTAAGD